LEGVDLETEIQPYGQRLGESAKAFAAFVVYRDMGEERSLEKVAQELGKSVSLLQRWSSQHEWVTRVLAWDTDRHQRHDAARIEADTQLLESEIAAYNSLVQRWEEMLRATPAIIERREQKRPNTNALYALVKLRRAIDNIGRRALGMPERIKENRFTGARGEDLIFEFAVVDRAPARPLSDDEDADDPPRLPY